MAKTKKKVFATRRERQQSNKIKNLEAELLDLQRVLDTKSLQITLGDEENARLSNKVIRHESSISALTTDLEVARAELKQSKDNSTANFEIAVELDSRLRDVILDKDALKRVLEMYIPKSK